MADVIQIERGAAPWRPSADSALIKQYQYYEIPMRGVIEQHGTHYYFGCLAGSDEVVSFWFYCRISPEEEAVLDGTDDPGTFDKAINHSGPAVFALAVERLGLLASTVVSELSPKSLEAACDALLDALREESQRWVEEGREVRSAVVA